MALQITGNDMNGSPLLSLHHGRGTLFSWGSFGEAKTRTGAATSLPGFNGERQDPLSGVTHLGNGYRAYSTALRRFTCPDSASPFGVGGINSYVYCENDPVNRTDPSGHAPVLRKLSKFSIKMGMEDDQANAMPTGLLTKSEESSGTALSAQTATGIPIEELEKRQDPVTNGVFEEILPKGTTLYKADKYEEGSLDFKDPSDKPWSGTYFAEKKEVSEGYLSDYSTPYLHKFKTTKDIRLLRFSDPLLANGEIPEEEKAKLLTNMLRDKKSLISDIPPDAYKTFTTLLENQGYAYKGLHDDENNYELILRNDFKKNLILVKTVPDKLNKNFEIQPSGKVIYPNN